MTLFKRTLGHERDEAGRCLDRSMLGRIVIGALLVLLGTDSRLPQSIVFVLADRLACPEVDQMRLAAGEAGHRLIGIKVIAWTFLSDEPCTSVP
jgi:hypothetical protein